MCGGKDCKGCKESVDERELGNYPIEPSEYPEIFEHFHNHTCSKLIPGFNRIFIRPSPSMSTIEEIVCTSCYINCLKSIRKPIECNAIFTKSMLVDQRNVARFAIKLC